MLFAALLCLSALSPIEAPDREPNVLLLKWTTATKPQDAARHLAAMAASKEFELSVKRPSVLGWYLINVGDDQVEQAVAALRKDRLVASAQPVFLQQALATVPNDELVDQLWGFTAIDAFEAWDTTVGLSSQRIGIVDTGLTRNHVDFQGRDVGGYDFIDDSADGGDGNGRDSDYNDEGGLGEFHGSHVAGTIGARANDGVGVPGLNWEAGLVSVRALGVQRTGSVVDIYEGVSWLAGIEVNGVPNIGANRVSVINLSLGSASACADFERDATSAAIALGVVVVAATGNDGNEVPAGSPADCPGVIAVGAMGGDFNIAHYSNFGDDRTDIFAPGGSLVGVAEEDVLSVDGSSNSGWVSHAGTSMASPHVAGVVSLMQAVNPSLSPAQIKSLLASSARFTCGNCGNKPFLDAVSAVTAAAEAVGEQPESCAVNAVVVDDVCTCLPGFVLNAAQDGCESPSNDSDCPANSTADGDECFCNEGFDVNAASDGCVAVVADNGDDGNDNNDDDGDDNNDDRDDNDDEDNDDSGSSRSRRSRLASSCDQGGSTPLWLSLGWLPIVAVRRRLVRQCARVLS